MVLSALQCEFGAVSVVLEDRLPTLALLRRRVSTLGLPRVVGQVLFAAIVRPALTRLGAERAMAIKQASSLKEATFDSTVVRVPSVNSDAAKAALKRLRPEVVVVSGTRIITDEILQAVPAPFINLHAGITPLYRGVHGGYWALVEGRPDLVGTTIHYVDKGIDTGSIIAQAGFEVTHADSFVTYPLLHTAAGIPLLLQAVHDVLSRTPAPPRTRTDIPSRLRSHPTLWGYLWHRVVHGVR
jgi:folate-dependent phosphoribosylglycinamide formyltransferase PurN